MFNFKPPTNQINDMRVNHNNSLTRNPNKYQSELANWLNTYYPHRANHIRKDINGGTWLTIKRDLDNDSIIDNYENPRVFYGTGFGGTTNIVVIDIDKKGDNTSYLHPENNPVEFHRFINDLQKLGFNSVVAIVSSTSGGIHIILIFDKPRKTRVVAHMLNEFFVANGYDVKSGQLECFPNVKKNENSLYNRVRLPLQDGSYVFDPLTFEKLNYTIYDLPKLYEHKKQFNDYRLFDAKYKEAERALSTQSVEKVIAVEKESANGKQRRKYDDKDVEFYNKYKDYDFTYTEELDTKLRQYLSDYRISGGVRKIKEELNEFLQNGFTSKGMTNIVRMNITRYLAFLTNFNALELVTVSHHILTTAKNYDKNTSDESKKTLLSDLLYCARMNRTEYVYHVAYKAGLRKTDENHKKQCIKIVLDKNRKKPTQHTKPTFERITEALQNVVNENNVFDCKKHLVSYIADKFKTSYTTLYNYFKQYADTELVQKTLRLVGLQNTVNENTVNENTVHKNENTKNKYTQLQKVLFNVCVNVIKNAHTKVEEEDKKPITAQSPTTPHTLQTTPDMPVTRFWQGFDLTYKGIIYHSTWSARLTGCGTVIVDTC